MQDLKPTLGNLRERGSDKARATLPADVSALSKAFSFVPPSYTDLRQAWDLHAAIEKHPLFGMLAGLSGKGAPHMPRP